MEAITSFSGEHRFLSNFWPCDVAWKGIRFPTVEHAYVAAKTDSKDDVTQILAMNSPGEVKRFGRNIQIRPSFNKEKLLIMNNLVTQKFKDPELICLLRSTCDVSIIEGNTWGDRFWGQCPIGEGENHLGKILMNIRDNLFFT